MEKNPGKLYEESWLKSWENYLDKTIRGASSEQNLVNKWSMILLVTITSSNNNHFNLKSQPVVVFQWVRVVELPPRLPLDPTSTQRRRKGSAKTCITPWGRNDQITIPVNRWRSSHRRLFFLPFGQFFPIWRGLYCHSFKQQNIKKTTNHQNQKKKTRQQKNKTSLKQPRYSWCWWRIFFPTDTPKKNHSHWYSWP